MIGRPYMLCRASNRCHTLKAAEWDELHWNDTAHVRTARGERTDAQPRVESLVEGGVASGAVTQY